MNRKLRIAFVDYVLEPARPGRSGLSDIVWDMAGALMDQGHEAHVIASYHTTTYPDPRVIVHNFPTPPIGYRNLLGHLWILGQAACIARQLQPDIVHAPEYISTAIFARLRVPIPLVLTVPGNVYHRITYGHSYEWHYLQMLKWAARTSARHCAAVIAISREMKHWWERTGSLDKQTPFIPLGASPQRFHPVPAARELLHISRDALCLLYVGRFAREKGLLDLVQALSKVEEQIRTRTVRVILIGKGPQADQIRQRITEYNLGASVEVRPWVPQDELRTWYSAADAVLLPSYSEGLSRTIPEALSCGTPVIGTRIAGTEDHIHPGINGFLFEPGDADVLAGIIVQAAGDANILRGMKPSCLAYAKTHLSWPSIVGRIAEEVYRPLIEKREHAMAGIPWPSR